MIKNLTLNIPFAGGQIKTVQDLRDLCGKLPAESYVLGFCGGNGYHWLEQIRHPKEFRYYSVGDTTAESKQDAILTVSGLLTALDRHHPTDRVRGKCDIIHTCLARTEDAFFNSQDKPLDRVDLRRHSIGTWRTVLIVE